MAQRPRRRAPQKNPGVAAGVAAAAAAAAAAEESELTRFDAALAISFADMSEQALESFGEPPPQSPAQVPSRSSLSAARSSGGDGGHVYGSQDEPAVLVPGEVFNPTVCYAFDEVRSTTLLDAPFSFRCCPIPHWSGGH